MQIISFYTDMRYREVYERLAASCRKFDYPLEGHYEPKANTWPLAIRFKPTFISRMYQKFGGPLLYLDADCEIVNKLDHLDSLLEVHNILVRHRNLHDKFNCGVMGFGKNIELIMPMIKTWRKLTQKNYGNSITVDQKSFDEALEQHKIVASQLPYQYNYLPHDELDFSLETACILHHKESRINNKAIFWRRMYIEDHPGERHLRKEKKVKEPKDDSGK